MKVKRESQTHPSSEPSLSTTSISTLPRASTEAAADVLSLGRKKGKIIEIFCGCARLSDAFEQFGLEAIRVDFTGNKD